MERPSQGSVDESPPDVPGNGWVWHLLFLALLAGQGWMTLGLFGADRPWDRLLDEQPILSGRHPLHLYHGYLGAQSFSRTNHFCAFDPQFDAGYPKTPIFDSGCRLAELVFALVESGYRPSLYKLMLAVACLLVPIFLFLGARAAGLRVASACLAATLGLLVWWGKTGRESLEAGNLDLLLGAAVSMAHTGLLLLYHRSPGVLAWLGMLLTACLGWLCNPLLMVLLLPFIVIYYLTTGPTHALSWHAGLLWALGGGLFLNFFWLVDWVSFWWIRAPFRGGVPDVVHRTFHTLWNASLWGDPADRVLALSLFAGALLGGVLLNQTKRRAEARLLGLALLTLLALASAGMASDELGQLGMQQLLVPGLLLATPLAAFAVEEAFDVLARGMGAPWRAGLVLCGLFGVACWAGLDHVRVLGERCEHPAPLQIGLSAERAAVATTLAEQTSAEARILWESRAAGSGWAALLPLLTHRAFVGGLDAESVIEHTQIELTDQRLAGRLLVDWSDAELEDYCRRYNIGWICCWSPTTLARFRAWPRADANATLTDGGIGCLFAVKRERSFALTGQARWLRADHQLISLADVVPENGSVVLSLHYQDGMRVSPSRVQIERHLDALDPIPLVRLNMAGPVARVTITWEEK
jgi:hypothetical protein